MVDVEIVRKWLWRLGKWEYTWVCLLVLATLVIHFTMINHPSEPMFDEQHYIPDARSILDGNGTLRPEHPPLGKLLVVCGMLLFGDTPLGWRFFSIIFGTASIFFFYLICRQLAMSRRASSLATFLIALENLTFVQASVAMLDVYSVTFMLASFWLYLRGHYPFAGVAVCLSILAKLSGVLSLIVIGLHWLIARRSRSAVFISSVAAVPILFIGLISVFGLPVYGQFTDPISRIITMLSLSSNVTFANAVHPYASRPWEWILQPQIMPYWLAPKYIAAISFTIWALIIPSFIYMVFLARKGNNIGTFSISWFAGTYLMWIPLSIISDRLSFVYYFYPTVGAICLPLGLGLSELIRIWKVRKESRLRRIAMSSVLSYFILHVAVFIVLSPLVEFWLPPST